MAELPSGTVTFLFTDVEGSTRLLQQLGAGYAEVLSEHDRILRAAFAAHGGREVDNQGDSFFVAFQTAKDAVAAAVDGQRDLAAHAWPAGAAVKVRMGLHTGEPKVGQERYVGIGVHRAARIGAAGHGGQVLLSWTTKGLAEEDSSAGVSIRDLGERRLKDIEQPQRLYQLVIDGLRTEFGPLNTLDVELARKRRRMYGGAALIGVVAAAVAIPVFAFGQGSGSSSVPVAPNSVAVIDPQTNRVSDDIQVGARPAGIAAGAGSIWVANLDDGTVSRIDPTTSRVVRAIPDPGISGALVAWRGAIWATTWNLSGHSMGLTRIDPQFDSITGRRRLYAPGNVLQSNASPAVAAACPALWLAPPGSPLTRVDPSASPVSQTVETNNYPSSVAVGEGAVWVADLNLHNVVEVDPVTSIVAATITVGNSPSAIAAGEGAVWVADRSDNKVVRIDPVADTVATTIAVGASPAGIAVGDGAVWVANTADGTVSRIDPQTNRVVKIITVGGSPQTIAVAAGKVWVTVQAPAPLASVKAGGTLRVVAMDDVDYMDPALAYGLNSWALEYATCAKLLNYPDKPLPAGNQLVPEVAAALPTRSADGKTYTFTVRKGFRFSPPSNAPVTAETFRHTIERTLNPKMKSPAALPPFVTDIVGEQAYQAGKATHISGISVRGDKLTIHLTDDNGTLPAWLATPFFCAVPTDTPIDQQGVGTVSSAGPYYVSSYIPGQGIVLKRNPNYTGSRPHHLDEIDFRPNVPQEQAVAEIAAGQADYSLDGAPRDQDGRLQARYGAASPAGRAGLQQYFDDSGSGHSYIALNTSRPLFADARLRRAVNYAINRQGLARLGDEFLGQPSDQYLQPTIPGFTHLHIYPLVPDLARAKRLAHGRHGTAVLYTFKYNPIWREVAAIIKANLKPIGINVEIKLLPPDTLFSRSETRGAPFDMAEGGWAQDYPDPSDFLNLLDGRLITATGNNDRSYFNSPAFNRRLDAAVKLTGAQRYRAYAQLDAYLTRNAAPWIPLGDSVLHDFYSARIGCQTYAPSLQSADLAALCIRGHAR
jgi:YVTN family beta-propeller protein